MILNLTVIKGNPDKYDDHPGFLTIEYYLNNSSDCYIDKKKPADSPHKVYTSFKKEILIANGILPFY